MRDKDLFKQQEKDRKNLHTDQEARNADQKAAFNAFKARLPSGGSEVIRQRIREEARGLRAGYLADMDAEKREAIRYIDECPVRLLAPGMRDWHSALEAITVSGADAERQLNVFLYRVRMHISEGDPGNLNPFMRAAYHTEAEISEISQKQQLTEWLRPLERRLKTLITLAGYLQQV